MTSVVKLSFNGFTHYFSLYICLRKEKKKKSRKSVFAFAWMYFSKFYNPRGNKTQKRRRKGRERWRKKGKK